MSNYPNIKRWSVLIGAILILFCTGSFYTFSIFSTPLAEVLGVSKPEVMIAFTISATIAPIPTIIGGKMTDLGYGKWTLVGGGLLFSLAFALTGFLSSVHMIYVVYGIVGGIGLNFAYSAALSNTLRLFPDKRGLAAGLITAGMGLGTTIGSPIAANLIKSFSVMQAFQYMGFAYVIICLLASFLIINAPTDYLPAGYIPPTQANTTKNFNWKQMLASKNFYLITAMLGIGSFSGLMISSNASPIGQSMFGLSATVAALYVSLYAISNSIGRILWGTISDKIGRSSTVLIIYSAIALSLIILTLPLGFSYPVGIIGLGLCFGGVMGVFPSLVMENFGAKHQGVNYGIVFSGFSIAAFFAPSMTAKIAVQNNGDYTQAFYIAIGLACVGILINLVYKQLEKKQKTV